MGKKKRHTYKYINIKTHTQQECAVMFHVSRCSSLSSPRAEFSQRQLCAAISSPVSSHLLQKCQMDTRLFCPRTFMNVFKMMTHPNQQWEWRWPCTEREKHFLWYMPSPVILRWMGRWHIKWMWAPVFITSRLPVMILNCTKPRRKSSR